MSYTNSIDVAGNVNFLVKWKFEKKIYIYYEKYKVMRYWMERF